MIGSLRIPNHRFALASLCFLVHLFVLPASVGVIKHDYLIPRCFVLWVASLVSSYFVCSPLSLVFSISGKSIRTTTVGGNRNY